MTPRHRARARLARHVPRVEESTERLPSSRMLEREEDTTAPRPVPSDRVRIPAEVRIKSLRPVKIGRNAPLLIRLVRHPYALRTVKAVRRAEEGRERPSILDREPFPSAVAELADLRDSYRVGRPMRDIPHRPEVRAHPFARAREAAAPSPVEPVSFDVDADGGWL